MESDSHKNISGTVRGKCGHPWDRKISPAKSAAAFANTSEIPAIAGCEFSVSVCRELGGGKQGQPLSLRGIKQFATGTLVTPSEEEAAFFKIKCPTGGSGEFSCLSCRGQQFWGKLLVPLRIELSDFSLSVPVAQHHFEFVHAFPGGAHGGEGNLFVIAPDSDLAAAPHDDALG